MAADYPQTSFDVRNAGGGSMRRLSAKQKANHERSRRKKLRRRLRLKERADNNPPELPKKTSAPRYMRRRRDLLGTSYWRGDRFVLENYRG